MRLSTGLLVSLLLLTGCLGAEDAGRPASTTSAAEDPNDSSSGDNAGIPSPTSQPSNSASPTTPARNTSAPPRPSSEPARETHQAPWPNVNAATIRPGVEVVAGESQCTSNFVFKDPWNATLYLGLAAHCVGGMKLGSDVKIQGATRPGTLAYSSWVTLGVPDCTDVSESRPECDNDFALIRIDAADRAKVHPAVVHFGGPTSLLDSSTLRTGDRVLTYGNSGLHADQEPLRRQEGIVSTPPEAQLVFRISNIPPSLPGDSGSGVMTRAGGAAGILVAIELTPVPGQIQAVSLDKALKTAVEEAGLEVILCTWAQLDDGVLP